MAQLFAKDLGIALELRPGSIVDTEDPIWLSMLLELTAFGTKRISDTVSIAAGDVIELEAEINKLSEGSVQKLTFESSDYDLIFEISWMGEQPDLSFGFWIGEPYQLMHGFRFVTTLENLCGFAANLRTEVAIVTHADVVRDSAA
jgi:hypothetical protein